MKCTRGYEITVQKSAAGYFLGTVDGEGIPNCRLTDYAATEAKAKKLSFNRTVAPENQFCSGGSCFKQEG